MNITKLEAATGAPDAEFLPFARMHWPAIVKALRLAESTAGNYFEYGGAGNQDEWQSLLRSALAFLNAIGETAAPRLGEDSH